MDTETQRATLGAVATWLSICAAHGYKVGGADVHHSALLQRLLSGKPPLLQPPPRHYSYGWYDLIDTGEGVAHEVGESVAFPGRLVIDQGADWEIRERGQDGPDGAEWWVVLCLTNGQVFRVERGITTARQVTRRAGKEPLTEDVPVPCWVLRRVFGGGEP